MASPYATGGGGTHFEARVTASCIAAVLCEGAVRGLTGEFAREVQTQRAAFGDPLDDLVLRGVLQDGRETRLDIQIKTKLTFTDKDDEWIDVLQRAWDTFSRDTFDAAVRRIGVGIGAYNARVNQHYQSVLAWATHSTDGQHFRERIEKGDYSHQDKQTFVATIEQVLAAHAGRSITNTELWRFLACFVIVHFDFQAGDASRDTAGVIDRLRGLLAADNRAQAPRIWDNLVARAGELIPVGGGATRATVVEQLTREGFVVGPAPSFWKDISALQRESLRALGDIKSHIQGLRLHRPEAYREVREALTDGRFVQIDGEPGTGKSALLKELADEAGHTGPVLVLKDTRIQPRGWAAHAHVLGVSGDLSALLREFGCGGDPILFIDGIDKIVDPAIQLTVNDVLKAIASSDMLAAWRVVVTVREQNLRHLETWLDPDALKKLPIRTVSVKSLDDQEINIVAARFPRLAPLLNQSGNADVILRRPFFLDAMLGLAGRAGTSLLPATEVELLTLWWDLGGSDRSDFSPAQHRRNLLTQLAQRLVIAPAKALIITDLVPEVIAELRSAGILRDKELGHSVVFAHDIYEEWALCELLIRQTSDLAAFLAAHAEPDALIRPVQLLGTLLLETSPTTETWEALYENATAASLRPVWQRAILTSCLQSTRATHLLRALTDYLLEQGGERLRKMLLAIATIEVVPNPFFLDEKLTPDLDPVDRAKFAQHTAVPKVLTWVRFLDWLMPLVPTLPPTLIPDLLPVFATWQSAFAGRQVRHCRQIGQLSYEWLREVEDANHTHNYTDLLAPFGGAIDGREIESPIRNLFLSSAGDVPQLASQYLKDTLADKRRVNQVRSKILNHCGALVWHRPADLVDFVLGAFLKTPQDLGERFNGYSDPFVRELGLAEDHQFYPASPVQLPFLGLLNAHEAEGLRLIRSLCNHAISFWQWNCGHARSSGPVEPLPITLSLPWGQQTFWGDGQVYVWFRGTWGNSAVKSALMALEQWALTQCENGAPFEEVFRKVIAGNDSVAVLGIGVSLCLAHPGACLECALPLATCPYLWEWDISRFTHDSRTPVNEMGNWHRYRSQLEAVHKLNQRPHRRLEIRNLLPLFVFSDNEEIKERYVCAIRAFPDNLPISYEHEKENQDYIQALRERMALFSEQGDPAYWKSGTTPDGKYIQYWSEPPSLAKETYQTRQQEHTRLNEFLSVGVWAQKALDDGSVGEGIAIDTAVGQAKGWQEPGVLAERDAEAFEDRQRTGAIAGAAFVAARHATGLHNGALFEWCQSVFDAATFATRTPDRWSSRGTILSIDPLIFATHGFAALLARDYNATHCQQALLQLAVDPLEAVQSAVFAAARYFADARPEFYWVLLDIAVSQCIVPAGEIPEFHSIVFDAQEAAFKQGLFSRAVGFLESGTTPELPHIPMPWIKTAAAARRRRDDTEGYDRNTTLFLHHVAAKALFQVALEPVLADAAKRAGFLRMVSELLEWTIQEIIPPFADSRHDHRGQTPFEWVLDFSGWCGRLCASLPAAEVRQVFLTRVFGLDTETALFITESLTRSFMIEALLKPSEITEDNMALWSEITDWIMASPEWAHNGSSEHLDREFLGCAFAVLFCVAPDFSRLICGIDPGWPHLARFTPLLERAIKEFGVHKTLYLGVSTLLKRGGFDLLPRPAMAWLQGIVELKRGDQAFWAANGDDTVELLQKLIAEKSNDLSPEDRRSVILISDILTDNGVRGAGFLQQELIRRSNPPG